MFWITCKLATVSNDVIVHLEQKKICTDLVLTCIFEMRGKSQSYPKLLVTSQSVIFTPMNWVVGRLSAISRLDLFVPGLIN